MADPRFICESFTAASLKTGDKAQAVMAGKKNAENLIFRQKVTTQMREEEKRCVELRENVAT